MQEDLQQERQTLEVNLSRPPEVYKSQPIPGVSGTVDPAVIVGAIHTGRPVGIGAQCALNAATAVVVEKLQAGHTAASSADKPQSLWAASGVAHATGCRIAMSRISKPPPQVPMECMLWNAWRVQQYHSVWRNLTTVVHPTCLREQHSLAPCSRSF